MRLRLHVSALATACASLILSGTVMPRPVSASAAPLFYVSAGCDVVGGGHVTYSANDYTADAAIELTLRALLHSTNVECVPGSVTLTVQRLS